MILNPIRSLTGSWSTTRPVSDWQPQNQFAWTATEPGTSLITAQVRDDQHDGPEGENGNRSDEFTINAPIPEIEPVEVSYPKRM